MCHVAEMFDVTAWHQMASSTFQGMAFDYPESLQSKAIILNALEAIWCQTAKSNISTTWHFFFKISYEQTIILAIDLSFENWPNFYVSPPL